MKHTLGKSLLILLAIALALGSYGCGGSLRRGPYATPSETSRDPSKAQQLTMEAAELIESDPVNAEKLLREALAADLWHGPAHNDLGVIHLKRGELYEAANEFEWARKLMPGHPDPRMNLALTLERAGRIDEALSTYQTALEVYPGHMPTMQAIARLQLRYGRTDEQTRKLLQQIALGGESEDWREWAKEQMIRLEGRDQSS